VEVATHFGIKPEEGASALRRLNDAHAIFLDPASGQIRMANPLSAVPTDYAVTVNNQILWANCAWDSLGIPAMLGADATIEAKNRVSGEKVSYSVKDGQLHAERGFVHFALPFARWYDNLIDT
jgi:hypothetical protein